MKLMALTLSLGTILFFMNCGPNAEFTYDEQLRSVVDGETVEVVSNEEFDAINNQGDNGINGTNTGMGDGGDSNDDRGLPGHSSHDDDDDSDDSYAGSENSGHRHGNEENHGKGKKCRDRLIEQHNNNRHDEMVTSPKEMDSDSDMAAIVRCGDKGNKVLVCHFPNADHSKRKTLCIGRPALEAHIEHLGKKRGSEHVDYAGRCKD